MIAVLWGAGPAVAEENKMTDTKETEQDTFCVDL
jgi:hypothetical protein